MGRRTYEGNIEDPCLDKLVLGEPFIVLRGQDIFTAQIARRWYKLAKDAGVNQAKLDRMQAEIENIENWPVKKIPD
jgi:hypothetical protein